MVGLIDMKQKWSALVEYWINYVTTNFEHTYDLDHKFFKVKFWNYNISRVVGLIDVKRKGIKSIGYWANYVTLHLDHDHNLEFSKSEFEIAFFQEREGWLTWNVNGAFMTMTMNWVTSDIGLLLVCHRHINSL